MTLHTVGPADAGEDERVIGRGYQGWAVYIVAAIPIGAAYFLDLKWTIAISAAAILVNMHEAGGRLHDLCIRLRRTNILLRGIQGADPNR